ncbi:MAG TPA: hypothetical protein VD788_02230 [Candidatus Polarisedimenticolaceae bacterium]|nr:hypothetical protein [Candidatus Polarisedimenticolaceae bacterium]
MRHGFHLLSAVAVLAFAYGGGSAAEAVTLEGGFVWERDDGTSDGALTAVLTPDGDGKWNVAFHFDWEDGAHVYSGTCEGSLTGNLAGEVQSDNQDNTMNFRFSGKFENGTFNGTHAFITKEGEVKDSGTLTLAAK